MDCPQAPLDAPVIQAAARTKKKAWRITIARVQELAAMVTQLGQDEQELRIVPPPSTVGGGSKLAVFGIAFLDNSS